MISKHIVIMMYVSTIIDALYTSIIWSYQFVFIKLTLEWYRNESFCTSVTKNGSNDLSNFNEKLNKFIIHSLRSSPEHFALYGASHPILILKVCVSKNVHPKLFQLKILYEFQRSTMNIRLHWKNTLVEMSWINNVYWNNLIGIPFKFPHTRSI